ncbi:alpha/beta hydrolase [Thalassobius sp. Cn5-15]|uniref:alpha/beta hydrolase n=1 Tax=Thalassobius sp. Cn5-15 TaxID=2917763 RepID=UPI001EF390B7|nr:alpha/beta hydrolase [Thalassobius sp. Cn5-15]MCG7494576.1 alpha/beta hydrolase [Thalassobius sp. Cn5-15]
MELDDAYSNGAYIDGAEHYPPRWTKAAAGFREGMLEAGLAELEVPYGDSARQCFDLFKPEDAPKGLLVFVHGGYWLAFDKSTWSHLAQGAVAAGWAVAMPSYDLCPQVSISEITHQIARMIPVAAAMIGGPIHLAGHSAGGHLVARMAVPGLLPDQVAARVKRVMPISPVADLRPLLKTSMNDKFKMDAVDARAESPVLQGLLEGVDVTVWVGGEERPAFLEQATALAEAWSCDCVIDAGRHHFDVIDGLMERDGRMLARLLG